jgi:hypothetical protein
VRNPLIQEAFFARLLRLDRFCRASLRSRSFFDTVRTIDRALLMRSAGVLPGTDGDGSGFMALVYYKMRDITLLLRQHVIGRLDGASQVAPYYPP